DRRLARERAARGLPRQLPERVRAAARDLLRDRFDQWARERRRPDEDFPPGLNADRPLDEQTGVLVDAWVAHDLTLYFPARVLTTRSIGQFLPVQEDSVRRNASISSAGSVSIRVDPRAPRATDTFAIVSMSGASTTLTKSNSPSVAH